MKPVEPAIARLAALAQEQEAPRLDEGTVLLVDDDGIVRMLTAAGLAERGWRVIEADCGARALELFERERPQVIALDAVMPDPDGFAICERLRRLPGGAHGADLVGRLLGKDLKEAMANVDRLLNIDVFTDDDVEMQNGVSLSSSFPPDEHGPVPRIEIHHRNRSARTIGNREFLFGFVNGASWGALANGDAAGALAGWEGGLAEDPPASDRIDLLAGLATVRVLRGEPVGDELAELGQLLSGVSDPQVTHNAPVTRGWEAFVTGRFEEARREWRTAAARP